MNSKKKKLIMNLLSLRDSVNALDNHSESLSTVFEEIEGKIQKTFNIKANLESKLSEADSEIEKIVRNMPKQYAVSPGLRIFLEYLNSERKRIADDLERNGKIIGEPYEKFLKNIEVENRKYKGYYNYYKIYFDVKKSMISTPGTQTLRVCDEIYSDIKGVDKDAVEMLKEVLSKDGSKIISQMGILKDAMDFLKFDKGIIGGTINGVFSLINRAAAKDVKAEKIDDVKKQADALYEVLIGGIESAAGGRLEESKAKEEKAKNARALIIRDVESIEEKYSILKDDKNKLIIQQQNINELRNNLENEFAVLLPKEYVNDVQVLDMFIRYLYYGQAENIGQCINIYEDRMIHEDILKAQMLTVNEISIMRNEVMSSLESIAYAQNAVAQGIKMNNELLDNANRLAVESNNFMNQQMQQAKESYDRSYKVAQDISNSVVTMESSLNDIIYRYKKEKASEGKIQYM